MSSTKTNNTDSTPANSRLGLWGMAAIVFGSMVGVGIFNIVQNMAIGASVGAVIISWVVTAAGMMFLLTTFKILQDRRPDLDAGIYQYAQVGYGNYVGFNIAWGYWICTAVGNVAYAVMLNDALGMFFPCFLDHSWPTVLLGTVLIWVMFFIVSMGVRSAAIINDAMSLLKVVCLLFIIGVLITSFDIGMFTADFWGDVAFDGDLVKQVGSTMMVTLWCFLGIEGAVVMAARAKRSRDVGKAGFMGFMAAWILYLLVSVLAYGVMSQADMAELENPSVAYMLKAVCGEWAFYFVSISVIVSLLGGWVAWTLLCAQVPYEAASVKILPRQFMRLNKHHAPEFGLFWSTMVMQCFIFVVVSAQQVYMAAIEIAGMMVLPSYLLSGMFLYKAGSKPDRYLGFNRATGINKYRIIGAICTVYCCWLIYAGGLDLMMLTSLLYVPGILFYVGARRQNIPNQGSVISLFTRRELALAAVIVVLALISLIKIFSGDNIMQ